MSTSTNNISLAIKYIFLNFAQAYFGEQHNRFTWNIDPRISNIIIADKFAIDLGVAVQRPSIILSRGAAAWTYAVRGQQGWINPHRTGNVKFGALTPALNDDRIRGIEFTDLYSGSITYNCVAKQGVEAEDIANKLFVALTVHKRDFATVGIYKFTSMSISEERLIRHGGTELFGVAINVSFLMQKSLGQSESLYNCRVWVCGDEYFEGLDFDVINNGTQIEFYEAPEDGCAILVTYVDAITLELRTEVNVGTGNGETKIFTLPNGGSVYGYYRILEGIIVDLDVDNGEIEQTALIGTQ
jgi:hypothetical protein